MLASRGRDPVAAPDIVSKARIVAGKLCILLHRRGDACARGGVAAVTVRDLRQPGVHVHGLRIQETARRASIRARPPLNGQAS